MKTAFFLVRRHKNVFLDLSGIPPRGLLDNPIFPCVDCQAGGIIINTEFNGAALQRQIMFSLRLDF